MGEGAVRLDTGEEWVSQELLGFDTALAEVEGTAATYTLGNEGVSFELASISSGEGDDRTRRCLSATRLQVQARHVRRGNPDPHEFGVIVFQDNEGKVVAKSRAPFMEDNSVQPLVSTDVHYELAPDGTGLWTLTVNADSDWLSDPGAGLAGEGRPHDGDRQPEPRLPNNQVRSR